MSCYINNETVNFSINEINKSCNYIFDEAVYLEKLNNFYCIIIMTDDLLLKNKYLFALLQSLLYNKYNYISLLKIMIYLQQNDLHGYDNSKLITSLASYNTISSAGPITIKFNPLEFCIKKKYIKYIELLCRYKLSNALYTSCTNYLNRFYCIYECLSFNNEGPFCDEVNNKCELCNIKAILNYNSFMFDYA